MFFDGIDLPERKTAVIKQLPPVPFTGWQTPKHFPNLVGNVKCLSVDVETKEPDFDHGPGWARGIGHIVGVSIGAVGHDNARDAWYFPVRHEVEPWDNLDPYHVFAWVKSILETPRIPKVGANLIYDMGWLSEEGIEVTGELHDCQFAEALMSESGQVNLEWLAKKYLNEGKDSNTLYEWLAEAYGGKPTGKQRANIYRAPPRLVGPYAISDADLPIRIVEEQYPLLYKDNLMDVYKLETEGIPLNIAMRRTGVNIDIKGAEKLHDELAVTVAQMSKQLYQDTGVHGKAWVPADCVKFFDAVGLKYPFTDKGAPSFVKSFLESVDHPIAQQIRDIREHEKIRGTFIESYLLNSNVNGRVHCQFHPLRGDDGGTRSGRDSSSTPNLQNIPVRTKLGKQVRSLFIPDEGHLCWQKNDYSQIEYRCLAHFAIGPGSDDLRAKYNANPKTDYHELVQKLVLEIAGLMIDRKPIKAINFGLLYGMGKKKLAKEIGRIMAEAKKIFDAYHKAAPYVKATMDATSREAEQLGYITTILNRRSHFDLWEPAQVNWDNRALPLPYYIAVKTYGPQIMRANTHKAINRRLQGSAADVFKTGMLKCWKAGIFDVTGVPKLRVHDEADSSVIDESPEQNEAYKAMKYEMENAIKLRVPVLVDSGRGPNWGAIE